MNILVLASFFFIRILTVSIENNVRSDTTHVLVVYAQDGNGQVGQIAKAIGDGATAASAMVKISTVEDANYKRDVFEWAHAIIVGSAVYNGNPDPTLLSFLNSFDFQDNLTSKVGGAFAAGGSPTAGLESTLDAMTRSLRTFGIIALGGNSWENAHGTGIVTNGSEMVKDSQLAFARDQGTRIARVAAILKATSPTPSPTPSPLIQEPPSWGRKWKAIVTANLTQVGYDAGLVIVNFTGHCEDPATQKMVTIYGDFDTVLTRCDMGYEFIINPPSRGGGCIARVIGRDANARICEACSCPFCVRDTQGKFTHGEKHPSKTVWESKRSMNVMGTQAIVWQGKAVSAIESFALQTTIAYSAENPSVPIFVNVTHPLWVQTSARISNFSNAISDHAFDIPSKCFAGLQVV